MAYFKAIAATGSISAAAAQEAVSRSALTSALDSLERSLRTQLFVRQKAHGVILTPTGERVLEMATVLLHDADQLEASIEEGHLTGTVAIGCFSSLGPFVVPALFDAFAERHPDVKIRAYAEPEDKLMQLLSTGEIEIAIGYNMHLDRSLTSVPLYETRMHVILSSGHQLAERPVVVAQDLADEPLILLDTPPSPDYVTAYFRDLGIVPYIKHRFSSYEVIRSLVARGHGYSLYIQQPTSSLSYEGLKLVAKPLAPAPRSEQVSASWPVGRHLSSNARAALEMLTAHAERIRPRDLYGIVQGADDAEYP
ncbi:LysR family transcriptional regulator [Rhodococcus ruber]|uniref:LysR family transcriptional regulator n=1 Tax=Rhodococcus ruber TaxID=1830 RepID=UPI00068CC2E9|nr:LysR family transcriptional regulator [Rhodococcus ruber]